jgi:flagellar motor protein MotB
MNEDIDGGFENAPVWTAFGDLMSALLGAFVLILVGVIGMQLELSGKLEQAVRQSKLETQRRESLEKALAIPLAAGRVTLVNGHIGIAGNVLFARNSDQLQPEGKVLLKSLAAPLSAYLNANDQVLMVSGFADDQQVLAGNRHFADNWDLSAQRALTVMRELIADQVPANAVFAAAFGSELPVSSNADDAGRARNRRVEIAPVPRAVPASGDTHE